MCVQLGCVFARCRQACYSPAMFKAIVTLAIIMSLANSNAHSAEIIVYSTTSLKEALIDLAPEFEHKSPHKLKMHYGGGAALAKEIPKGVQGDLFIGPDD